MASIFKLIKNDSLYFFLIQSAGMRCFGLVQDLTICPTPSLLLFKANLVTNITQIDYGNRLVNHAGICFHCQK